MMRRPRHRPERVAEAIRQTVAEFLTGNVRDPRVGFVTVTAVGASSALGSARGRGSVVGSGGDKAAAPAGLAGAAPFPPPPGAHEPTPRPTPQLAIVLAP